MNSKPTRQRILFGVAIAILALYAVIGFLDAGEAQARLDDARTDLSEVVNKLNDVQRWKQAPKVAALSLESPAEIANRIAAARQNAGLPGSSLLKEEPLDPQRIQRTDFEMRSTNIELAPATLPQILAFCDGLRDEETGSIVRDITLSEPQSGANGGGQEKWGAKLTLTQMIFSPTSR